MQMPTQAQIQMQRREGNRLQYNQNHGRTQRGVLKRRLPFNLLMGNMASAVELLPLVLVYPSPS